MDQAAPHGTSETKYVCFDILRLTLCWTTWRMRVVISDARLELLISYVQVLSSPTQQAETSETAASLASWWSAFRPHATFAAELAARCTLQNNRRDVIWSRCLPRCPHLFFFSTSYISSLRTCPLKCVCYKSNMHSPPLPLSTQKLSSQRGQIFEEVATLNPVYTKYKQVHRYD